MSEKPLKIVPAPEAKSSPAADAPAAKNSGRYTRLRRKRLRTVLLVILPAIAALIGLVLYFAGGRYISTDNAYVGAQKVLFTTDISDKIIHVAIIEGQHVKPGDELFTLDPVPFRLALEQAQAKLAAARSDYDKLKANLTSLVTLVDLANHTVVRAPISGTATQVDNIQVGRFIAAGTPILSVIDDQAPWVDANPKETDITYLRVGQKASLAVDSFPDHTFQGTVIAVSPGTGAQFSILPPQNATGNWVKVVQRVPLRIAFDKDEDTKLLRSGMSVNVEIDTGHSRLPFLSANAKEPAK